MLMNNCFSKKNSLLYKMKCINTRNAIYEPLEKYDYDKVEKYDDKK